MEHPGQAPQPGSKPWKKISFKLAASISLIITVAFAALRDSLSSLRIGEPQTHKGITIFPLTLPGDSGPDHLSLDDAMASGRFRVAEVSQAGSVPEIKVLNECDRPALLIDGEELLGAKQNRVVNASTLPTSASASNSMSLRFMVWMPV